MKRTFLFLTTLATLAAGAAQAHTGHIAPAGGHDHGEILAAIAVVVAAVAITLRVLRRQR